MTKEIGGYFELELGVKQKPLFTKDAVFVNSGRNAFEYIIRSLPQIDKLWLPYFTCSSLEEPLSRLSINVQYYRITKQLEIESLNQIEVGENDYILYTNYFGVKEKYAQTLQTKFGRKLIIDNSQALFAKPTELCFYSPRKFVGIPDGGVAFSPFNMEISEQDKNSYQRCSHLLKRYDHRASDGYSDFKLSSQTISNQPLLQMSSLTKKILETIDFEKVKKLRTDNFAFLHQQLNHRNQLVLDDEISGALVYPYLNLRVTNLKEKLIKNKIYVATYWPNVLLSKSVETTEYILADLLVNLPIDQRYSDKDMMKILSFIQLL